MEPAPACAGRTVGGSTHLSRLATRLAVKAPQALSVRASPSVLLSRIALGQFYSISSVCVHVHHSTTSSLQYDVISIVIIY